MNIEKIKPYLQKDWVFLTIILLLSFSIETLWISLDKSVPAWDQAAHLSSAYGTWQEWQNPQIFNGQWWFEYWQNKGSYRGPLVYIFTVPIFNLLGPGYQEGMFVNFIFTTIIFVCNYHLGKILFNSNIGKWSAILVLLFPAFIEVKLDYLLDYGLTAFVTLGFTFLTYWKLTEKPLLSWVYSFGFGISLGLLMLTKTTGFLFIFFPSLFLIGKYIFQKDLNRLIQCIFILMIAWLVCGNLYKYNWLLIITNTLNANSVGRRENDPEINTLSGWLYYLKILPKMIGWPIFITSLGLGSLNFGKQFLKTKKITINQNLIWLLIFILGAYFTCSLGTNKDFRFILPYLSGIAILSAYLLNLIYNNWSKYLRIGAALLTVLFLLVNLFPLPFNLKLSQQHLPDQGKPWPHKQIIAEVINNAPFLKHNLAVLSNNTPEINSFTFDFYGRLNYPQVYARETENNLAKIEENSRSFEWYLVREKNVTLKESQIKLKEILAKSSEVKLAKKWPLPDGDIINLYQRKKTPVEVTKLNENLTKVQLKSVEVNQEILRGKPVAISYKITGNWSELKDGLLLLTWQGKNDKWLHDHAIANNRLASGFQEPSIAQGFQVIENLAMLPPENLEAGIYKLKATYLNRKTGESYPLESNFTVNINPNLEALAAPELDFVTRLYNLNSQVREGKIEKAINKLSSLNLYDPKQDYLKQVETAFEYRLKANPNQLDLLYSVMLAQVLQRKVEPLLKTLNTLTKIDSNNPYSWLYLGFVRLYNFQPNLAEKALNQGEKLDKSIAEINTLKGVASVMKFRFFKAWQLFTIKPE